MVTNEDLAFAADVRARDGALRAWMGKRCSYHPSELPADVNPPTNEERSRAEVIEFLANPPKFGDPSYFCYLSSDKKRLTTFTGDTLATIARLEPRRVRNSWSTDERGSFWARGIDGKLYHGTHNGAGMFARMRVAKYQELFS